MSSPVNFPYVITSKMSNSKIIIEQLLDTVESLVNQDNEGYKQIHDRRVELKKQYGHLAVESITAAATSELNIRLKKAKKTKARLTRHVAILQQQIIELEHTPAIL